MAKGDIVGRAYGICDQHGKLLYRDRRAARKAARMYVDRKNTYECDYVPGMYHVGGLPPRVIRGEITRGEAYPRRAA